MRRIPGAALGLLILSLGTTGVATAQAQTTRTAAAAQTSGAVPRCVTAQLSVQIKPGSPGAGQRHATIVLTNKTATTCTVFGHGGMALLGPPAVGVPTDLRRNTTPAATTVTLTPGGSARSLLHWAAVPGPGEATSGACEPTAPSVAVTPPDQTTAALLGWSGGPRSANTAASTRTPEKRGVPIILLGTARRLDWLSRLRLGDLHTTNCRSIPPRCEGAPGEDALLLVVFAVPTTR